MKRSRSSSTTVRVVWTWCGRRKIVNSLLDKYVTVTCLNILSFRRNYDDICRLLTRETSIICLILFLMIVFLSAKHTLVGIKLYRLPLQSNYTCTACFLSSSFQSVSVSWTNPGWLHHWPRLGCHLFGNHMHLDLPEAVTEPVKWHYRLVNITT